MGSGKDRFFERKPILRSLHIVVSEAGIESDNPDGHEPDHSSEMTIPALGNPALPIMLAGLVYGRINPCHGNQLFVIFEIPDITSHLDEKVCCRFLTNPPKRSHYINVISHVLSVAKAFVIASKPSPVHRARRRTGLYQPSEITKRVDLHVRRNIAHALRLIVGGYNFAEILIINFMKKSAPAPAMIGKYREQLVALLDHTFMTQAAIQVLAALLRVYLVPLDLRVIKTIDVDGDAVIMRGKSRWNLLVTTAIKRGCIIGLGWPRSLKHP